MTKRCVWTDKGSKIFKIVSKLRAGVVWANTYNKFDPRSPFGGYKESGFGAKAGATLVAHLQLKLAVSRSTDHRSYGDRNSPAFKTWAIICHSSTSRARFGSHRSKARQMQCEQG